MGIPVDLIQKLQLGIDKLINRSNAERLVTYLRRFYAEKRGHRVKIKT